EWMKQTEKCWSKRHETRSISLTAAARLRIDARYAWNSTPSRLHGALRSRRVPALPDTESRGIGPRDESVALGRAATAGRPYLVALPDDLHRRQHVSRRGLLDICHHLVDRLDLLVGKLLLPSGDIAGLHPCCFSSFGSIPHCTSRRTPIATYRTDRISPASAHLVSGIQLIHHREPASAHDGCA